MQPSRRQSRCATPSSEGYDDTARHWSDSALGGTEFLAAFYRAFYFPPHFHETYAIGIIEKGGQFFRPRRASGLVMPAGKLCVINPGVVHEGRAATPDGWRYRMFYPSIDVVGRALGTAGGAVPVFAANVLDDPELYESFYRLHRASFETESVLERDCRAVLFLRQLFQRHAGIKVGAGDVDRGGNEARTVSVAREYLYARWNQPVRLSELASQAEVAEAHLIRSFSRAVGMPPHAYQLALRIDRAKGLLRSGMLLADVAIAAGFYDQSQMTRHFKRIVGTTPGSYARSVSGIAKTFG